jgi:hypothetical protein
MIAKNSSDSNPNFYFYEFFYHPGTRNASFRLQTLNQINYKKAPLDLVKK